MGDTWVTDMTDYLDERGRLVAMPGPARRLADHFGAIVVSAASAPPGRLVSTSVACRRRPRRRPCPGRIQAIINPALRIRWECPECGDNGLISGWQDTPWDPRRVGALQ